MKASMAPRGLWIAGLLEGVLIWRLSAAEPAPKSRPEWLVDERLVTSELGAHSAQFKLEQRYGGVSIYFRRNDVRHEADPGTPLGTEDRLETSDNSWAALGNSNRFVAIDQQSRMRIEAKPAEPTPSLIDGQFFLRSRGGQATNLWVQVPTNGPPVKTSRLEDRLLPSDSMAALVGPFQIVGTDVHVRRNPDTGQWVMTVIDGIVQVGRTPLVGAPRRVPQATLDIGGGFTNSTPLGLSALRREIQWLLYYPAVLHLEDLPWANGAIPPELDASVRAYRLGKLREAWEQYQQARDGGAPGSSPSPAETIYRANLLLGIGRFDTTEPELSAIAIQGGGGERGERLRRMAYALLKVAAAVRAEEFPGALERDLGGDRQPKSATEWLAESYYQQSRVRLPAPRRGGWRGQAYGGIKSGLGRALAAAERAVSVEQGATNFWFGWIRRANLHFSHGDLEGTQAALQVLRNNGLTNAPVLTLQGFVSASRPNRKSQEEAISYFVQAIEADPLLTDAWLGLALLQLRRTGQPDTTGLTYLEEAVSREPGRSMLRSYLGKAQFDAGLEYRAERELDAAKNLDANDPTPWLYSALAKHGQYRVNEAARDLEESIELNSNRAVYRSDLLLDQDQAVRGANLAAIYRDAGLVDPSVREATKALQYDYANGSAHQFLANSYDALRDPQQVNLRYETPWLNELLLANLLQPVGVGSLSQTVSQQEYSRLFYRDHVGAYSSTEYQSAGDWLQQGSIYLTKGPLAASFDAYYLNQNGFRPNQDQENLALWGKIKYQLSPHDSLLFQILHADVTSGDLNQYYDPTNAHLGLRIHETEEPILLGGYHHEWAGAPEHHTLLLFSRLDNTLTQDDTSAPTTVIFRNPDHSLDTNFVSAQFLSDLHYESSVEIYSGELQHIWQPQEGWWVVDGSSTIVGGRVQAGTFETSDRLSNFVGRPFYPPILFPSAFADSEVSSDFNRYSIYAYENLRFEDLWYGDLLLTLGLSYDYLHYPVNHRTSPITSEEAHRDQVSPKLGFIWTVNPKLTVRGSYTKSLGGVSLDQSFRLEPTQVAGFLQSFRSIIPEAVAGATVAPRFETWGAAADYQLGDSLFLGVRGEWLESDASKVEGVLDSVLGQPAVGSALDSEIDFRERSLWVDLGYLARKDLSFNVRYRLSHADYDQSAAVGSTDVSALLHEVDGSVLYNHSFNRVLGHDLDGSWAWFTQFDAIWRAQSNFDYQPDLPGDDIWQFNFSLGLRFPRRTAELRLGVLNLTDANYRFNPLNLQRDLPRERTFFVGLRWNFERGI